MFLLIFLQNEIVKHCDVSRYFLMHSFIKDLDLFLSLDKLHYIYSAPKQLALIAFYVVVVK